MKRPCLVLSLFALLPLLAGAPTTADAGPADSKVGETRAVYKAAGTVLRATPNTLGQAVVTLPRGTHVVILQVQLPWLQVRSGSGTGWLRAPETVEPSAIRTNPKPTFKTDRIGGRVSAKDVAAAGRQFDSATEQRYRRNRADMKRGYQGVDQMEAMTAALDPVDSVEFIVAGYLGRRGRDYALPGRLPRSKPSRSSRRTPNIGKGGRDIMGKVGGLLGKKIGGKKGESIGKRALPAVAQAVQGLQALGEQLNKKFTPEQEYYLGRAVAAKSIAQHGVDPDINRRMYVKRLGDAIVRLSNRVPANFGGYHFEVLDSDAVNGISGPGGFVLITRGAVKACQTEAELAGILSHELAHITKRHAEAILRKGNVMAQHHKNFANILMSATGANDIPVLQGLERWFSAAVDDLHVTASSRGYGRQLEFDADLEGTNLLFDVYYDHMALRDLLQRMAATGGNRGSATHAAPGVRAQWLTQQTARYKPFTPMDGVKENRKARFVSSAMN